jgi:hypothetical protein
METEDILISELKKLILKDNLDEYLDLVKNRDPESVKNEHWRFFLRMINNGGDPALNAVSAVFRQVMCDTIANVLAVFDGSAILETLRGDFRIFYDDKPLSQTLSDTFWETEEKSG